MFTIPTLTAVEQEAARTAILELAAQDAGTPAPVVLGEDEDWIGDQMEIEADQSYEFAITLGLTTEKAFGDMTEADFALNRAAGKWLKEIQ